MSLTVKARRRGAIVAVYEDPCTETRRVGFGKIVRCVDNDVGVIEGRVLRRYEIRMDTTPSELSEFTVLDAAVCP